MKITSLQRKIKIELGIIKQAGEETLRKEGNPRAEVSVLLVTDNYIRKLNREYRGVPEVTDVLAFPMQEGKFSGLNPELLGDVIISVERARRQAREFQHKFKEELSLLVVHGILHLLGYDDRTPAGREKMRAREEAILKYMK